MNQILIKETKMRNPSERHLKHFILAIILMAFSSGLSAETLFTCGESSGWSYNFSGGMVPDSKTGFQKDGISGAKTSVVVTQENGFDILFIDAMGKIKSAVAQGAKVAPLSNGDNGIISLLMIYPAELIEIYSYDINRKKLLLTQHKYDGIIARKASMFESDCS